MFLLQAVFLCTVSLVISRHVLVKRANIDVPLDAWSLLSSAATGGRFVVGNTAHIETPKLINNKKQQANPGADSQGFRPFLGNNAQNPNGGRTGQDDFQFHPFNLHQQQPFQQRNEVPAFRSFVPQDGTGQEAGDEARRNRC